MSTAVTAKLGTLQDAIGLIVEEAVASASADAMRQLTRVTTAIHEKWIASARMATAVDLQTRAVASGSNISLEFLHNELKRTGGKLNSIVD